MYHARRNEMEKEILGDLKKAIMSFDKEKAKSLAKEIIDRKIDPLEALNSITEAMRKIGDGYNKGELWLPDLVGAADVMQDIMPIIEKEIERKGAKREALGTVVIGTVYGDIHNIGKTMVATLLQAEGFIIHDLGVNVKAEAFIEAIEKYKADILAMSALLTTTAPEQEKIVKNLKKKKLRSKVKIIVGGAPITKEFANSIGADGYDPTAPGAVKLARSLMGK